MAPGSYSRRTRERISNSHLMVILREKKPAAPDAGADEELAVWSRNADGTTVPFPLP